MSESSTGNGSALLGGKDRVAAAVDASDVRNAISTLRTELNRWKRRNTTATCASASPPRVVWGWCDARRAEGADR